MYGQSQITVTKTLKGAQYAVNINEYDSKRIANIIRRYQQLRSAAEVTAAKYEGIKGSSGLIQGKDDMVCMLADIDQGIATLSTRQLTVVGLLKRGYLIEEIGKMLGLSPVTVKFHVKRAVSRLVAYLNAPQCRERGVKR